MNTEDIQNIPGVGIPAGFWIRLCANLLDLILITLLVVGFAQLGAQLGWYIPIEITVLLAGAVYILVSEVWTQRTVGRWFCGLRVVGRHGEVPNRHRLLLRVLAGKVLFLLPFGIRFLFGQFSRSAGLSMVALLFVLSASFVWCAFDRQKRAWHDWLAGTMILRHWPPCGRWSMPVAAAIIIGIGLWFVGIGDRISIARDQRVLQSEKPLPLAYEQRDPKVLVEAGSWDKADRVNAIQWLKTNAMSPGDYVVAKAQQYQVLICGESHGTKDQLDFLNALIPRLHEQAGVTAVVLESCLAGDNAELERLVTGKTFDRDLALRLARRDPWGTWGFREYWDILETVWQVNQSIVPPAKRMRIIGLESALDNQSDALLGNNGDGEPIIPKYCPWWEGLRRFRLVRHELRTEARDVQMAARIEREVFGRGERAIVWIGRAHACASPSIVFNGQRNWTMGALLRQKHPKDVCLLWLHAKGIPLPEILESIVPACGLPAAGFDIGACPLALLRDSKTFEFQFEPRLALIDLMDGYIFLKPSSQMRPCTWISNYVSPAMFAAAKPFYRLLGNQNGGPLNSAAEVNAYFINRRAGK